MKGSWSAGPYARVASTSTLRATRAAWRRRESSAVRSSFACSIPVIAGASTSLKNTAHNCRNVTASDRTRKNCDRPYCLA